MRVFMYVYTCVCVNVHVQRAFFYKSFPSTYGANLWGCYPLPMGRDLWGYKSSVWGWTCFTYGVAAFDLWGSMG